MQGCGFVAFEGQTVKAIVVDGFTKTVCKQIDAICAEVEVQTARKGFWFRVDENGEFVVAAPSSCRIARKKSSAASALRTVIL